MASPSPDVRSWRTSFLTLRDETLNPPPPSSLLTLLQNVILSHPSASLIAAAAQLPSHEVNAVFLVCISFWEIPNSLFRLQITSDLVLLAGLASATLECPDAAAASLQICHLVTSIRFYFVGIRILFLDSWCSKWEWLLNFHIWSINFWFCCSLLVSRLMNVIFLLFSPPVQVQWFVLLEWVLSY